MNAANMFGLVCFGASLVSIGTSADASTDYYNILGLSPDASQTEIKKEYKKLVLRYHPDKNPAEDAQQQFIQIQKAYEVLSDPERRQSYDNRRKFFGGDVEDNEQGSSAHPPDYGAGQIFNTVEEFSTAAASSDIWLIHIYVNRHEMFGYWMKQLPRDIHLGHVNLQRIEGFRAHIARMFGGGMPSVPLLMLCQHNNCQPFRPSFQDQFFGIAEGVTRRALEFMDYEQTVRVLGSDAELRQFAAFRSGGSCMLRVAVLLRQQARHFEIAGAAMRFRGQAQVAQISYHDFASANNQLGEFTSSFKLRTLPAVVFFDPLTGDHDLIQGGHALDNLGDTVEHLIGGHGRSSMIFPIQELTADAYTWRCVQQQPCDWIFILAVTANIEARAGDLSAAVKAFAGACKMLATLKAHLSQTAACFVLRLGRAPDWDALLRKHKVGGTQGRTVFGLGRGYLSGAPNDAYASPRVMLRWFQTAMALASNAVPLDSGSWPPLLPPVFTEPQDVFSEMNSFVGHGLRRIRFIVEAAVEGIYANDLTYVALFVIAVGSLLWFLWEFISQGHQELTPVEALAKVEFSISVTLRRSEDTKFGITFAQIERGLQINGIAPGGILDVWNTAEERGFRRIREGDLITAVSVRRGSRLVNITHADGVPMMVRALREATAVLLRIVPTSKTDRGLSRLVSMIGLTEMSLIDCAKFSTPNSGFSNDLEIVELGPQLQTWNNSRRQAGACCMQCVEVGDRIVAVDNHTQVRAQLARGSPVVVLCRWLPSSSVVSQRFEVSLERTEETQDWGMRLNMDIENPQICMVTQLCTPSLVADPNSHESKNPRDGCQVLPGDRVLSINGLDGREAFRTQLQKLKAVLLCERWSVNPAEIALPGMKTDVEVKQNTLENSLCQTAGADEWNADFGFEDDTALRPANPEQIAIVSDSTQTAPDAEDTALSKAAVERDTTHDLLGKIESACKIADTDGWDVDFDLEEDAMPLSACTDRTPADSGNAALPAPNAEPRTFEAARESNGKTEVACKTVDTDGWNDDFDFVEDAMPSLACTDHAPVISCDATPAGTEPRTLESSMFSKNHSAASCASFNGLPSLDASLEQSAKHRSAPGSNATLLSNHGQCQFSSSLPLSCTPHAAGEGQRAAETVRHSATLPFARIAAASGDEATDEVGKFTPKLYHAYDYDSKQRDRQASSSRRTRLKSVLNTKPTAEVLRSNTMRKESLLRSKLLELEAPSFAPEEVFAGLAPLYELDPVGECVQDGGFAVLAAKGSPKYLQSLRRSCLSFKEHGHHARFYYEERLPAGSLMVLHIQEQRCRWFSPSYLDSIGVDTVAQLLASLDWHSDNLACGFPILFDPEDFTAGSFGACLGRPAEHIDGSATIT